MSTQPPGYGPPAQPHQPAQPFQGGYPQPGPWQQQGYGPAPWPHDGYPQAPIQPLPPLADWGQRVLAFLIDMAPVLVVYVVWFFVFFASFVPLFVSTARSSYDQGSSYDPGVVEVAGGLAGAAGWAVAVASYLAVIGFQIWNRYFRQGRTGQSIGKSLVGIQLVGERTMAPVGPGMAFLRDLCHQLDGAVYIGYFWPLWDDKRRTFADMICTTVVVKTPQGPVPLSRLRLSSRG